MQAEVIKSKLVQVNYMLGLLLVFWMPLENDYIPFLSAIWLLSGLVAVRKAHFKSSAIRWRYVLLFVAFYLMHIISVFYSENREAAWFDLEIKIPLLLFPLFVVLLMQERYRKRRDYFMLAFIIGNVVASIICIGVAFFSHDYFSTSNFMYQELSYFHHPSYFALYLTFSLAVLLFRFLPAVQKGQHLRLALIVVGALFMLLMVFMLSSRAGILAVLIVLFVKMVRVWIKSGLPVIWKAVISLVLIGGITVGLMSNARFNLMVRNVTGLFALKQDSGSSKRLSSSDLRIAFWESSLDIIEDNWLAGVGNGDVKDRLSEKATKDYLNNGLRLRYNAHNQFLDSFLAMGIPGILLLLGILLWPLIYGLKTGNWLLLTLALILIVNLFFESMLNRQAGIIFTSFFLPLLFGIKRTG